MTDFIILPRDDNSSHNIIRSVNVDFKFGEESKFKDYVNCRNQEPKITWFSADDWSLRLLGEGTNNGCNHYLILGRPGGDYAKQVDLKMSIEVDIEVAVSFLESHPEVSSAFFGTIFLDTTNGAISNSDILAGCSWMARLDGKIVECSDPTIAYERVNFDIYEYINVTPFGKNGTYLVTTNPSLVKYNSNVHGTCSKTGSKFVTLPKNTDFHNTFITHPLFDDTCTILPNDVFPTHVLVDDKFTVEIYNSLLEVWGISSGPDMKVISNIPYTKNNNTYTFDFTNMTVGVIDFSLDLGHSQVLNRLNRKHFPNHTVTIMRK
jgi:hypothetical protein